MVAQEFIRKCIEAIAEKFSFLQYAYYWGELDGTHFILVSPNDFFEQFNEELVAVQNKAILEFIELYPTQHLAFVDDEELFKGEEPLFVIGSSESLDME